MEADKEQREERRRVATAIETLTRIAERPTGKWDAIQFLAGGGVVALAAHTLVEELLRVVNFSMHTTVGITDIFIRTATGAAPVALYYRQPELATLIDTLDAIRANPAAVRRKLGSTWENDLRGYLATVRVGDEERVVLAGNNAAWSFVLRELAREPLCDSLCRCQRPECGRFFFHPFDRVGGPPQYCALPEAMVAGKTCAVRARLEKQAERQAALRRGMSVEDYRIMKETGKRPSRRRR